MSVAILHCDPFQFFIRLYGKRNICFLSGSGKEKWDTIIAFDPAEVFSSDAGNINDFLEFIARSTALKRKVIGYLSYEVGCKLHKVSINARDDINLYGIFFCAFDNYISFRGKRAFIHYRDPAFPREVAAIIGRQPMSWPNRKPCFFVPEMTRRWYRLTFQKIKQYIENGEIYQVNLSHRLKAQSDSPPEALFISLCKRNPVGFLAFLNCGEFQILSASPERFIKIRRRFIYTYPIKGTRPYSWRNGSAMRSRVELVCDEKEQAELSMITDLLRNDLGKICQPGSVRVTCRRAVRRCAGVWHAYSTVSGRLASDIDSIQALLSMLPGGSISGCPKRRALEIIDDVEPTARGIYTGVIGLISPNGNLDFSIAIRTIIKKGTKLWLQVGGGIVYGSQEEREYQETFDKARSLQGLC